MYKNTLDKCILWVYIHKQAVRMYNYKQIIKEREDQAKTHKGKYSTTPAIER